MPPIGWLNNSAAGQGGPGPNGVDLICNKSTLVSKHFFNIHVMNLMHASTCPLLWWWYDDYITHSILRFLQNLLNFHETSLLPASHIIFIGYPYSEKGSHI